MGGHEEQNKRYFSPSTKGKKILAFGLTEPEACSNWLEMKITYDGKGASIKNLKARWEMRGGELDESRECYWRLL
jgi:alkylation response protein AidB-like acyl-CoA dehydrogenase